jgi:ABC-type Zn uptake system ZnuABC Zn-binding protein ZnuA
VVANVGDDHIDLTALLPVGADPHSFEATPSDYRALEGAHVLFINGLHLEEALAPILDSVRDETPVVSVNAGIQPLTLADEAGHAGGGEAETEKQGREGVDPHTWMDVRNVQQWVANIQQALSELDPANAAAYAENADRYLAELADLEKELADKVAELPVDERKLVTDHGAFGYFANAYDFTVVGTVIPSFSTLASPSAQDLARLQDQIGAEDVKAIFVGMTINPKLADQLASDLDIQVVPLYTGSLSDKDGPAATYIDYMRYNVNAIVDALK